jgi:hypothetical protein
VYELKGSTNVTGTQFREWSSDARQFNGEQRTQVAGGCMVNIKTELSDGRVIYKQCGKPSKSTPCGAHSKEPQAFLASLHPMHPAQPCPPYTNHTEWEFFQEIDAKAIDRSIDTFVRAAATLMVLMCLWVLAGSLSPALGSASPIAFPTAWYASGVSGAHCLSCDTTDPSGTDVGNEPHSLPPHRLYGTHWQTDNLLLATVSATIVVMLVAVYTFRLISEPRTKKQSRGTQTTSKELKDAKRILQQY